MSDELTIRELKEIAEYPSGALQIAVKERDLLRRQVEALVRLVTRNWCSKFPRRRPCQFDRGTPGCKENLLAWSLEHAKEGGG